MGFVLSRLKPRNKFFLCLLRSWQLEVPVAVQHSFASLKKEEQCERTGAANPVPCSCSFSSQVGQKTPRIRSSGGEGFFFLSSFSVIRQETTEAPYVLKSLIFAARCATSVKPYCRRSRCKGRFVPTAPGLEVMSSSSSRGPGSPAGAQQSCRVFH